MGLPVIQRLQDDEAIFYACPGCGVNHCLPVGKVLPPGFSRLWQWNGSLDEPTLTPSVLRTAQGRDGSHQICHHFVTDGKLRFLPDCTHPLAGYTVPMAPIE